MDIEKIREALERLNGFTYHAADNQDAEDIKIICDAISTIDPEAIRAEARTEYRAEHDAYIRTLRNFRDNWDCDEDAHAHGTTCRVCEAADVLSHFARVAILSDEPEKREVERPKVCGNCLHGRSTSLDDIRCYKSCPYIATGLHCKACEDWEPCGTSDNPRALIVERKRKEAAR